MGACQRKTDNNKSGLQEKGSSCSASVSNSDRSPKTFTQGPTFPVGTCRPDLQFPFQLESQNNKMTAPPDRRQKLVIRAAHSSGD